MVPLAPKLKVITYHFISYRRKSVFNLVEIQNTKVTFSREGSCTRVLVPITTNGYPFKRIFKTDRVW